jgi:putative MATE family efflux protein
MRQRTTEIPGMFEGPVWPVALRIAVPMMTASLLQFLYAVCDTFFIARIDPSSTALLSGTGLMFPLFFLFMSAGMSINAGMSSVVGRIVGEGNDAARRHTMPSGWLLGVLIALPAMLTGYIGGERIMRVLAGEGLSEEALGYGLTYFRWVLPGLALVVIGHAFMGILQGEGLTRIIARGMILSTLTNTALDPILIFVLDMGVAGAGLATSLSVVIAAVYIVSAFVRGLSSVPFSLNPLRAHRGILTEILRIGFPHFLSMASLSLTFMVFNKLVSGIDQSSMNAWTIARRMDQLVFIPAFAVGGATVSIVAQNYGREQLARARKVYWRLTGLGIVLVAGAALVYVLAAPVLFAVFSSVPSVVGTAVRQVRLLSFTFTGITAAVIAGSALQAVGKPVAAFVLLLLRVGLVSIPLAFVLVTVCGMGMNGIFLGMGIGNLTALPLSAAFTWWHLRRLTFRRAVPL